MASLDIAGIDDIRIGAENLAIVHVSQRPILVSLVGERLQRTRRIVCLFGDPGEVRVQHSNIEEVRERAGIVCGEVLNDLRSGKTLSVDGYAQRVAGERLRLGTLENVNVG